MKTSGWSSNAKTASAAYLAYLATERAIKEPVESIFCHWTGLDCGPNECCRPMLWTGWEVYSLLSFKFFSYGYEGDDEWQEYQPITSCFDCLSYNGDNIYCERPGI